MYVQQVDILISKNQALQITTLWLEQIQYACKFPVKSNQLNENPQCEPGTPQYIEVLRQAVVSHEAKKKQHACALLGLCDHYSKLFTRMAALNF